MPEFLFGPKRKRAVATRPGRISGPRDLRGRPGTGRIARLYVGQGHGYIRLANEREVFFHRADVKDGTSFNDLQVRDVVTFELFEDAVSGARALRVARLNRSR